MDTVIRGGTVVTADGEGQVDVGIRDGRVAQLGGSMAGAQEIDAEGKLLIPGGVDMHVHLSPVELEGESVQWADDFVSGSRAAAAGGVTTLGNITFPRRDEGLLAVVDRVAADASAHSVVDFVLHPVLLDPSDDAISDIPRLAEHGHTSVKTFMSIGSFDARAGDFLRALAVAGQHGVLTMAHCEDACLIEHVTSQLLAEGRGDLRNYGRSRPALSELSAVRRMIAFAEIADAPVYIVHLGSAAALAEAREAQARGLRVYVETRPIYLHFTQDRFAGDDAPLYVGNPPLRGAGDQEALWAGLAGGHVHTCCTDHAAWPLDQKLDPTLTIATARPGMSDLETHLPLLFSEGVRKGRISLQRFVELTSTNAAKLFGLFPRKGTIAVGSDADLVIWDPEETRTVSGRDGLSRAGYSLYDGWEVTGWPSATLSRGRVVYADGEIIGQPGDGSLVHRSPTRPL